MAAPWILKRSIFSCKKCKYFSLRTIWCHFIFRWTLAGPEVSRLVTNYEAVSGAKDVKKGNNLSVTEGNSARVPNHTWLRYYKQKWHCPKESQNQMLLSGWISYGEYTATTFHQDIWWICCTWHTPNRDIQSYIQADRHCVWWILEVKSEVWGTVKTRKSNQEESYRHRQNSVKLAKLLSFTQLWTRPGLTYLPESKDNTTWSHQPKQRSKSMSNVLLIHVGTVGMGIVWIFMSPVPVPVPLIGSGSWRFLFRFQNE